MTEWESFDDAVARGDWARLRTLAQTALTEWRSVRGFAEALTGASAGNLDEVLVDLLAAAKAEPVDATQVERATVRLRALVEGE